MGAKLNQELYIEIRADNADQSPFDYGIEAICQPFGNEHIGNADDKKGILITYPCGILKPSIIIWLVDLQLKFA